MVAPNRRSRWQGKHFGCHEVWQGNGRELRRLRPNRREAAARRLFFERHDSPDEAPDPPDGQHYGENECDHDSVITRVYGNFADSEMRVKDCSRRGIEAVKVAPE